MKKNVIIVTLIVILVMMSMSSMAVDQETIDPLVTLSYLEKRIEEFKEYVDYKIASGDTGNVSQPMATYEVVNVSKGKKVIFTHESVEFILRSGEATAIASEQGGLADLTAGVDLSTGMSIKKNHLMLIPRDDGRGVTAKTDIWIMIKGTYELK